MKRVSVPIKTRFEVQEKLNDEFTKYKCFVLGLGKNRNGSYFSQEVVEDALDSFKHIPVIGFVYKDDNGNYRIAGHEQKLAEINGKSKWVTKCIAYGCVPGDDFAFEDVVEKNGQTVRYLTCSIILWTGKFPIICETAGCEDEPWAQSMEICVNKARSLPEDNRYTEVMSFNASALCLLGKYDDAEFDVLPCFPSAGIYPFSYDDSFEQSMNEFKLAMENCFQQNTINGGEKEAMDNENFEAVDSIEEAVEEVQEGTVEAVQEEFEGQPVEDTTEKTQEEQFEEEQNIKDAENTEKVFSSLYSEKRDAIGDAVRKMSSYDYDNDKYEGFWLCDFDDEYAYVEHYVSDQNGESNGVGRFAYSFNEGEKSAYLTSNFEVMYVKWLTADQLAEIENKNREFESLKQFKNDRLAEIHKEEVENILDQFEDLNGNEEFEAFKEAAYSYEDLEALSDKCFSIRGKAVKPIANKKSNNDYRMPIRHIDDKASSRYGNLFETYNNKD